MSSPFLFFFFFNDTATTEIYTLSLHDALPIWPVRPVGIGQVAGLIAIMVAEPGHRERQVVFIAAFGNEVEIVVRVDRVLAAASVRGISVEDVAILVLVEDADAGRFRTGELHEIVVVFDFAFGQLLRSE